MAVRLKVTLRGNPLRRTYVSHFDFFRLPQTLFFQTDDDGRVTITNAGNANVSADPNGPSGEIRVRVHAQNSVVRVLDGAAPIPLEVTQEFSVADNGAVNINTVAEQREHYEVMDECLTVYETVFRQFRPFNRSDRGAFPFGRGETILATRNRLPRIEVSYPDHSVAEVSWVEPASVGTGYPLLHLKAGKQGAIPHELAHALYFALMPASTRASVETQYLGWLMSEIAAGRPPFHNTFLATSKFVAWIEAFGLFAERFFRHAKANATLPPLEVRKSFFRGQLLPDTHGGAVGNLTNGAVHALATGDNVEGAIFGALFVDFARRVGLREAVGLYLGSADNGVLSFDNLRNLIITETDFDSEIVAVANTWQL